MKFFKKIKPHITIGSILPRNYSFKDLSEWSFYLIMMVAGLVIMSVAWIIVKIFKYVF